MKQPSRLLALLLSFSVFWAPFPTIAEDIDIFTGGSISASNPNILIVLDNTSNWARASQNWPGGLQQGQAEARAIQRLLSENVVNSGVNLGLFEFVTEGNANNNGGFVRFPILPMTVDNKATLSAKLQTIYDNVNSSGEKRSSNTPYGNLLYDVRNYLTGSATYDLLNPPNADAASDGYTTPYSVFKSPITADSGCGRTFMIFVSNPNASGPSNDDAANRTAMGSLGCDVTDAPFPTYSSSSETRQVALDSGNYASAAACEAAALATYGTAYESYTCEEIATTATSTTLVASACGYASEAACVAAANTTYGTAYSSYACEATGAVCLGNVPLGTSTCGQYSSVADCLSGAATAFPGFSSYSCAASASTCSGGATSLGNTNCGEFSTAAACESGAASLWPGYSSYSCSSLGSCTSTDLDGNACYSSVAACQSAVLAANSGYSSVTCSSGSSCNQVVTTCAASNAYNNASKCNAGAPALLPSGTYTGYTCSAGANCSGGKTWTITGVTGTSSYSALGNGTTWSVIGTIPSSGTRYDMSGSGGNAYSIKGISGTTTYTIYGNYTVTGLPTGSFSSVSNDWMADEWARCLRETDMSPDGTPAVAEAFSADFSGSGAIVGADTISFDGATTTLSGGETPQQIAAAVAATSYSNWYAINNGTDAIVLFGKKVAGASTDVVAGDFAIVDAGSTGTGPVVTVTKTTEGEDATGGAVGVQNVTTYTIDVFNAQQNLDHTALMANMALQGGGRYFAAKSEDQILRALKQIISEIQSVNTAFAAASIPLSTTNRSQNLNEVYIGVFRPSLDPRWFGNLKKFKIKSDGSDLVDTLGNTALNSQTGFLNDCAVSFWTTDSGAWWENVAIGGRTSLENPLINPTPRSTCADMPPGNTSPWSDLPDGQSVEKGSVASVIRRGNDPPTTTTSPSWQVNRTIYTRSGAALAPLSAAASGSTDLYNYTRGVDINVSGAHVSEKSTAISNPVRPSVHGDVVHSRPLAVNYGTDDTVIFYGANDGMLRAVDGATGKEKWAFIPAEFLETARQTRLMQNTPLVAFGASPPAGSTLKDYMFDGSAGLYQSSGNTKVWLFPTQRRGGRMLHALDVTNSAVPALKWYAGCPNLGDDAGCSSGFDEMGQTWSVPVVTKIKGWDSGSLDDTTPVVVVGGGYDTCEDVEPTVNPPTWSCGSAKGRAIYVIRADNGDLIRKFTLTGMRGVTGGVSFVDVNNDGYSDYGYAADLGGAIYRLSFVDDPATVVALEDDDWTIKKVAYASGGRKFMFSPAVAYAGSSTVYVALGSGDRERPLVDDYPYVMDVENMVYAYRDTLNAHDAAVTACHLDDTSTTDSDMDGVTDSCVLDYGTTNATCDSPGIPIGDAKKAWRVGLVYRGEQVVTQALILGGMVAVNSTRPVPAGACSAALGEGGGYFLNLLNGSGAIGVTGSCGGDVRGSFIGVGLPTDPVVVNLPGLDPICIGCVSRQPANPSVGSKLFEPTSIKPPISARKYRKYRYQLVD